ncbi:MAG TPA: SDR family oxidoreductase, partial [Syntrophomonas sp.]|nr:SDR family oxidoreductase [Syntrophomonas sp.]
GIGGATAITLAEAGAAVVIGDIILENAEQVVQQIKSSGGKALAVKCSVDVNVNAVCPGIVRTAMWEKMLDEGSAFLREDREDLWNRFTKDIPLKRPQEAEDVAACIAFLCSDLAKNITGQGININGGQLCH